MIKAIQDLSNAFKGGKNLDDNTKIEAIKQLTNVLRPGYEVTPNASRADIAVVNATFLVARCRQLAITRPLDVELQSRRPSPSITVQHEVLRMNQEGLVISQDGWIGFVVG